MIFTDFPGRKWVLSMCSVGNLPISEASQSTGKKFLTSMKMGEFTNFWQGNFVEFLLGENLSSNFNVFQNPRSILYLEKLLCRDLVPSRSSALSRVSGIMKQSKF